MSKVKGTISKEQIKQSIRKVGLNPEDKKPVGKYSLGMRQRLGLAQAIMENPELLILDEPMNGFDKDGVSDMRKYLLNLKEQGKTILIASHSTEDIEILCDILPYGRLRKKGDCSGAENDRRGAYPRKSRHDPREPSGAV